MRGECRWFFMSTKAGLMVVDVERRPSCYVLAKLNQTRFASRKIPFPIYFHERTPSGLHIQSLYKRSEKSISDARLIEKIVSFAIPCPSRSQHLHLTNSPGLLVTDSVFSSKSFISPVIQMESARGPNFARNMLECAHNDLYVSAEDQNESNTFKLRF